jgi:hypothetical protein
MGQAMEVQLIRRLDSRQVIMAGIVIIGVLTGPRAVSARSDFRENPAVTTEDLGGQLDITLTLRGADTEQGILLRVNIENQHQTPYTLDVCPSC